MEEHRDVAARPGENQRDGHTCWQQDLREATDEVV
jgi:hypothetical protein